ncbi:MULTISPECIES: hypothetical protein [Aerosakkonema]|uniref:hypothetical protein n=1 Tax=Aerosakkonema TaxID=1246629 RepID=UPI0035B81E86
MNIYTILSQAKCQRVTDGAVLPILSGCESSPRQLVLLLPQLGDFDSLEYAWWLRRDADKLQAQEIALRAVGIGDPLG